MQPHDVAVEEELRGHDHRDVAIAPGRHEVSESLRLDEGPPSVVVVGSVVVAVDEHPATLRLQSAPEPPMDTGEGGIP